MKVLIIGSRSIKHMDISDYILKNTELIITGGAQDGDSIAEKYADNHRISKLIIRPQYNVYKKSAPLKRNDKMVDLCDIVIAVWDGKAKGTLKFSVPFAIP